MSWKIVYDAKACRDLAKLPSRDHERIVERIERLTGDQRGLDIKALRGDDRSRLRVGNYRVLFRAEPSNERYKVLRILRRNEQTFRLHVWLAIFGAA